MARTDRSLAAGALDQRVVVQSNTTTPDSQGGRSSSWGTFATIWASVKAVSGSEVLQTAAVTSLVSYEIEARWRADLTPGMRVLWTPRGAAAAKVLEVLAVRLGVVPDRLCLLCGEVA